MTDPTTPVKKEAIYQAVVMVGDTLSRMRVCIESVGAYITGNKEHLPPSIAVSLAAMMEQFKPELEVAATAEGDLRRLADSMREVPLEDKAALVNSLKELLAQVAPQLTAAAATTEPDPKS